MAPIARIMTVELLGPEKAVVGITFLPGEKDLYAFMSSAVRSFPAEVGRHVRIKREFNLIDTRSILLHLLLNTTRNQRVINERLSDLSHVACVHRHESR